MNDIPDVKEAVVEIYCKQLKSRPKSAFRELARCHDAKSNTSCL